MNKYLLSIIALITFGKGTYGQSNWIGAENTAQANTLVAVINDEAYFTNPATLSYLKSKSLHLAYQQVYPIEGLSNKAFWVNIPTKNLVFAAGADMFGDQYYHESNIGLAFAKKQDRVGMGVKLAYQNIGIKEMLNRSKLMAEFGLLVKINKKLDIGMQAINLTNYKDPTIVNLGFGFKASKQVNINGQMEMPVGKSPTLRLGFCYFPKENLQIMSGVNPAKKAICVGLGYKFKNNKIVYAAETDTIFGIKSNFSLHHNL